MNIIELTYHNGRYHPLNGPYPWHETMRTEYPTKEEAYHDACHWAARYEQADTMGNMASVLGVIKTPNGWCGVVNYYHSNT